MFSLNKYSLPTYFPMGPVNVYLINEYPLTLIDAGPANADAYRILEEGLKANGIKITDIKRIILTHGHPDHIGMADKLQECSGAEVWLHHEDLSRVRNGYWRFDELLLERLGIPKKHIEEIFEQAQQRNLNYGSRLNCAQSLYGGEHFEFEDFSFKVYATPGHSPGCISLHEEKSGMLFSGDHLLEGITPNPVLEPDAKGSWISTSRQYLNSLRDVLRIPLQRVYPGHGQEFCDVEAKAKEVLQNYLEKIEQISPVVAKGWQTPFTLAQILYPWTNGFQLFLAVSKVIGILDLMQAAGQVELIEKDSFIGFQRSK